MKTRIKNKHRITLQNCTRTRKIPSRYYFQRWVNLALATQKQKREVHIRLVDRAESAYLNETYRHKTGPTNILSFPFDAPENIHFPLLGDLIICAPVMTQEATEQKKLLTAHWAHITIHGVLHLLGYDHIKNKDAQIMESLEIELLQQLGYENPYE